MGRQISVKVLLVQGNVLAHLVGLELGLEIVPIGIGETVQDGAGLELVDTLADVSANVGVSYKAAFTSYESFMLKGAFTYSGTGSFGLAFDFNGKEEQYKLVSLNPADNILSLSFQDGAVPITEVKAPLAPNQTHTFTYIQDGSIGIFYLDNQAAPVRSYQQTHLLVRGE